MTKLKTLTLHVKTEYFEQIASGEKLEEYRTFSGYWRKRLVGRRYDILQICKGYPPKSDLRRRLIFKYDGYIVKTITHPHFGDEPVKVFAIKLGERK